MSTNGTTILWESDTGAQKGFIDLETELVSLDYALSENEVGVAVLEFVPCSTAESIELWDRLTINWSDGCGGPVVCEGDTVWFVLDIDDRATHRHNFITIRAYTANVLIEGRSSPAYATTAAAKSVGPADDVLKQIWTAHYSNLAVEANGSGVMVSAMQRSLQPYVTMQAIASSAPPVGKAYSWRKNNMKVMKEVAEDSTRLGTPLFFDIIKQTDGSLMFITKTVARQANRLYGQSSNPVTLSVTNGSLIESTYRRNHRDEKTFAYGAGRGEELQRLHGESNDPVRESVSVFGRRETIRDARNTHDPSLLPSEARSAVVAGRPQRGIDVVLSAEFLSQYNSEWRWGDLLGVSHGKHNIAVAVSKVAVSMRDGEATVKPTLVERYGFTF